MPRPSFRFANEDEVWSPGLLAAWLAEFVRAVQAIHPAPATRVVVMYAAYPNHPDSMEGLHALEAAAVKLEQETACSLQILCIDVDAEVDFDAIKAAATVPTPTPADELIPDPPAQASPEEAVRLDDESLARSDRCDTGACGAQALVRATLTTGPLYFCAHHYTKAETTLEALILAIRDERDTITQRH